MLQEPAVEGLPERFERAIPADRGDDSLLLVAEDHRRQGAGTAHMEAAEDWTREKSAVVSLTDTNLSSALSVPFYENRMGYRRQAVILRKRLR